MQTNTHVDHVILAHERTENVTYVIQKATLVLTLSLSTAAALKWSHTKHHPYTKHTHTLSLAALVQLFVCTHTFYVGVQQLLFLAVIYQSRALATFSFLQGHGRHLQYVTRMSLLPAQLVHMRCRCKCVLTQIHMKCCCKNYSNTVYSNSNAVRKLTRAKVFSKMRNWRKKKNQIRVHVTHKENGTSLYPQCVYLIHKQKVVCQWRSQ